MKSKGAIPARSRFAARLLAIAVAVCVAMPASVDAAPRGKSQGKPQARESTGLSDPLVLRAQELLSAAGYYTGALDGRMGPETRTAIRAYQRANGFKVDGKATEELITQLETGEKVGVLLKRLDATRAVNIEKARQALLSHPETRKFLEGSRSEDVADPTRDPSPCFDNPAPKCLLAEALESAKAIHKPEMRDWALGEILVAQAKAGLLNEALGTVRRILDPRLIMVALRDIAKSQAIAGRADDALAAADIIPDPIKKAEAIAAIAEIHSKRKAKKEAHATVERLMGSLDGVKDTLKHASFHAQSAVIMFRAGEREEVERHLKQAKESAKAQSAKNRRDTAYRHVANAMIKMNRLDDALSAMRRMKSKSNRLPILVSTASAFARAGSLNKALKIAAKIDEDRYRSVVLARIAVSQATNGRIATGKETIGIAMNVAKSVKFPYARSFAYSRITLALGEMDKWTKGASIGDALKTAKLIKDDQLRAHTLWTVARLQAKRGDKKGAETAESLAREATKSIKSRLSQVWVYGDVSSSRAAEDAMDAAWSAFANGMDVARNIQNSWGRSRALAKMAQTLAELLEPSLRHAPEEPKGRR